MEKLNLWLSTTWQSVKTFFNKKYYNIPLWQYCSGVLIIGILIYLLMPKKKYK